MLKQGPLWQGKAQANRRLQRVRSGEKPYLCDQCGKICSERATRINHQR